MNAKSLFRIFFVAIFATAALFAVINPTPASAQEGAPEVWNPSSCSGESAIVYQERGNTGDGVTLSVFDAWGCPETLTERQGLFLVEPWDGDENRDITKFPDKFNPDAGCFVNTWSEAQTFSKRTGLENGSAWIVAASMLEDPLVVHCDDVVDADSFGLNPNENQIDPKRIDWVTARRAELLGTADTASAEEAAAPAEDTAAPAAEESAADAAGEEESIVPEGCAKNTRDGDFLCAPDGTWVFAPLSGDEEESNNSSPSGWSIWWAAHPWWQLVIALVLGFGIFASIKWLLPRSKWWWFLTGSLIAATVAMLIIWLF